MVITDFDELYGFEIPDGWTVEKLEPKVGNVKSGKRLPKGYYVVDTHTNHPYIRVIDMRQGYVDTSDLRYVPEEAFSAIQNYRIYKDDIYISVAGTLGIVGQIPEHLDGANLTENANRVTNIKCNIKYLMYWLMGSIIQNTISQTQTLGAQPKLALTRIRNFPVILPPEKEQEKIAGALSDVDTLITDLQKLIRKKEDIRQGTMQMLVTGKKRLDGYSGEWEATTLNNLCKLITKQTGFDYSAEIKPSLVTEEQIGTLPFIQNKDFEGFDINYNTDFYIPYDVAIKYPKILLDEVCLLISISGRIGNVARFDNRYEAFAGGAVGIAKFYDPSLVEWCTLYLQSSAGQGQIFSHEKVGAQHNLTVEDVRRLEIRLPKKREREEIVEIMGDIDLEIHKLEEKLSKYQKVKQGMMEELLTGKVRLV